jgi:hypothetical protein
MKKKYLLPVLLISILFIGASCGKEKERVLSSAEIIGGDGYIRDEIEINIDEDEEKERVVLYVVNKEIEKDDTLWCGNLSGEKLKGIFYLAIIDNNEIKSKIELLMEQLENGGEYKEKNIIFPQDLNGNGKELEFIFDSYASCSGSYVEIIGWEVEKKELIRYQFYKQESSSEEEVFEELFISSTAGPGIEYRDGFLIQKYYSNADPAGTFHSYYSFSKEKEGYDFIKSTKISD